ncbi:MAG: hypothetical protein AAB368_00200 [bacterium]
MINPYLVLGVALVGLVLASLVVWWDERGARRPRPTAHASRRH